MDTDRINICDKKARFEFIINSPPLSHSELQGYVEEFECRLLYDISGDDDDEMDEKIIGKASGYRLGLNSCYWEFDENNRDAIHPIDLLDYIDDHVAKLICLFDEYSDIKSKYRRKLTKFLDEDILPPDILLIKRLEVLARYRGKNFGEALIANSIYMLGRKNDLVVLNPFPLQLEYIKDKEVKTQWQEELQLDNFTQDQSWAKKKLGNYYKKLGFKKLTEDGLIFLALTSPRL